jgi:ribosome production factor 1
VLPCAEYYKRQGFPLKKIVAFASGRDYSDLLVFNEDRKEVNGLLHVHLPDGPTAHYRISSLVLGQDIKVWTTVKFQIVSLVLECGMYVLAVAEYRA